MKELSSFIIVDGIPQKNRQKLLRNLRVCNNTLLLSINYYINYKLIIYKLIDYDDAVCL